MAIFASAWGVKLTREPDEVDADEQALAAGKMTLAEMMAAAQMPVAGGDTAAASRAILEEMAARAGRRAA